MAKVYCIPADFGNRFPRDAAPPSADTPARVSIAVRNTGRRPGREVVQLYLSRPESAVERMRDLYPEVEITSHSGPAHVALNSPLVDRLRAVGDFEVQPKQAWTNVADFAARGLDAINLGPGATRYAHAVDERVEITELERTFKALQRFLTGSVQ